MDNKAGASTAVKTSPDSLRAKRLCARLHMSKQGDEGRKEDCAGGDDTVVVLREGGRERERDLNGKNNNKNGAPERAMGRIVG